MKLKIWPVLVATLSTSLLAQTNPPVPPAPVLPPNGPAAATAPAAPTAVEPAPAATNAPAKKKTVTHKKRKPAAAKAKEPALPDTPVSLTPGPAEVNVASLTVRGQASLKGETVAHLAKGDAVTVIEQINLSKHKAGEPAQWAKIALPTNVNVWVSARFIDATNKTVLPKKLNLRAGPGENYSVVGLIERGAPVSEIKTKGSWMEIAPPPNAYAFVAAKYLKQEATPPALLAANTPPSAPPPAAPTPTTVPEAPPILTAPPTAPVVPEAAPTPMALLSTNAPAPAPEVDTNLPPPPPREVTHEGFVRHVRSIIEPTDYVLYDPKTGDEIDYLYTTSTNLNLGRYKGLHIIVTGKEGLAPRWHDTPVLTVEKILVLE